MNDAGDDAGAAAAAAAAAEEEAADMFALIGVPDDQVRLRTNLTSWSPLTIRSNLTSWSTLIG